MNIKRFSTQSIATTKTVAWWVQSENVFLSENVDCFCRESYAIF